MKLKRILIILALLLIAGGALGIWMGIQNNNEGLHYGNVGAAGYCADVNTGVNTRVHQDIGVSRDNHVGFI